MGSLFLNILLKLVPESFHALKKSFLKKFEEMIIAKIQEKCYQGSNFEFQKAKPIEKS